MPEPDHRLVPVPSAQLALAGNHLALLNKILPPAVLGPAPGRPWEIAHLGLKLVWIKPGTFMMGRPKNKDEMFDLLSLATQVTISRGYWLAATQVTQMQWETMMGNNPSVFKTAGKTAPVENVTWGEVMAFCKKLTEQERVAGRLSDKEEYTLPTEAQWEYACRAGTTGYYAGDIDAMAWYDKICRYQVGQRLKNINQSHTTAIRDTTHPVGTKQPNEWGLYDMHGNVWEWCRDWHTSYYPGGAVTDPSGPASGSDRVCRGGCWCSKAMDCRSESRFFSSPRNIGRGDHLGFRLALSSTR
jgi:formylglycine-generating enzyme required for sulfatase activity